MPLVTASIVSKHTGLPESSNPKGGLVEKAVQGGRSHAEHVCITRLGWARYAAACGFSTESGSVAERRCRELLEGAAARLAVATVLPSINIKAVPEGGIITSTGWDASREELLSPNGVNTTVRALRDEARYMLDALRKELSADGALVEPPRPYAPQPVFIL